MRSTLPKVKGAAKAKAQGQAMMSTDVKTFMALLESTINQNEVANTAIIKMLMVNRLLIWLVIFVNANDLSFLNTSLLQSCVK